ncbi:MAG TPA: 2-amino-4-hydroxy-6-hydroxymethyldihydropteridine diphosphokinase [Patescibacteria group bacterium]|nr:2-amino-4-hydroxy-6-hydroxymethyldihydropteridine diphosphokinase [Patescibacteria group bacterium]
MSTVYIALGSNLGEREKYLQQAIEALKKLGSVAAVSSFYDTEPVGYTNQPNFLNAAIKLETTVSPQELIQKTIQIEKEQGRVRDPQNQNGPRTIDIDILLYDDLIISEPQLTIPHPRMHERKFVLEPLAEIAPGAVHPVLHKTISELLDTLL